ncbi:MAG: ribonuclease HI [Desulfotalea sp.]|nr:MAG: ribonuclease HI [Desulfotalea sp.]
MAKKKFYAVAVGRTKGVFTDWTTTEQQVKGFAGAKYKSFPSEKEALSWMNAPVYEKKTAKTTGHKPTAAIRFSADDIIIYTDGGSINNPGPGGYGAVVERDGGRQEYSGGFRLTTNNRMEMTAALVALYEIGATKQSIHLFSDSSYLVNGVEKGWARKWQSRGWKKSDGQAAVNIDLWQKLLDLLGTIEVTFHWVKGHAGHELNERCDTLAVAAARNKPTTIDTGYEERDA